MATVTSPTARVLEMVAKLSPEVRMLALGLMPVTRRAKAGTRAWYERLFTRPVILSVSKPCVSHRQRA